MWCIEKGTNAEKLKKLISHMLGNIESDGYIIPELHELSKIIENICKTIVNFWKNYDRKKSSVIQYQSGWLNKYESILLKRTHCKSNQNEGPY